MPTETGDADENDDNDDDDAGDETMSKLSGRLDDSERCSSFYSLDLKQISVDLASSMSTNGLTREDSLSGWLT